MSQETAREFDARVRNTSGLSALTAENRMKEILGEDDYRRYKEIEHEIDCVACGLAKKNIYDLSKDQAEKFIVLAQKCCSVLFPKKFSFYCACLDKLKDNVSNEAYRNLIDTLNNRTNPPAPPSENSGERLREDEID